MRPLSAVDKAPRVFPSNKTGFFDAWTAFFRRSKRAGTHGWLLTWQKVALWVPFYFIFCSFFSSIRRFYATDIAARRDALALRVCHSLAKPFSQPPQATRTFSAKTKTDSSATPPPLPFSDSFFVVRALRQAEGRLVDLLDRQHYCLVRAEACRVRRGIFFWVPSVPSYEGVGARQPLRNEFIGRGRGHALVPQLVSQTRNDDKPCYYLDIAPIPIRCRLVRCVVNNRPNLTARRTSPFVFAEAPHKRSCPKQTPQHPLCTGFLTPLSQFPLHA